MKKLIVALIFCIIAVPAMADTWTFNPTVTGGVADHFVYHHGILPDGVSAQDFINSDGLNVIPIPASEPQTFKLDYPDGTQYGMFVEVVDTLGNTVMVMDNLDGVLSPTVWTFTAIPEIVGAHYNEVIPSTSGDINVNVSVTVGR